MTPTELHQMLEDIRKKTGVIITRQFGKGAPGQEPVTGLVATGDTFTHRAALLKAGWAQLDARWLPGRDFEKALQKFSKTVLSNRYKVVRETVEPTADDVSVTLRYVDDCVIRSRLKKQGAKWDAKNKVWIVGKEAWENVKDDLLADETTWTKVANVANNYYPTRPLSIDEVKKLIGFIRVK